MYTIDKKAEIDAMCQELIQYLNTPDKDPEALMISAINVATIQLDYANYEVGVLDKQRRRLMISDAESDLMRALIEKKRYAKRIGLGLDRLVEMYTAGEIR